MKAEAIRCQKMEAEVERQLPGQKFCSHPPHCTLICGKYQEPKHWRDELADALVPQSSIHIQTTEFGIFYADALAGGGHTLLFRVRPTPEIFALQKTCGGVLKLRRSEVESAVCTGLLAREPFRSSFAEYGFPFVGAHWIPHFTVASLKVAKDAPLLRSIISGNAKYEFMLDHVSVWEIDGDSHTKLFELPISGARPNVN